jgi:predicted dehydrogenase
MRKLKLAVIGVGHLGKHHARILKGLDGVELVGVSDAHEANCRQVAELHQVQAFPDYREVIGRVDAAVLAVPTVLHHRLGCELLAAGVHLLIEKPLAPSLAEADELVQIARRAGVTLACGHVERFNPGLAAAQPHLIDPKYIEATRTSGYTFRSTDIGAVFDIMIHDIDVALSLVKSPPVRVEALGMSVFGGHEDVANARVTFGNGCVATFSASRASYVSLRQFQAWSGGAYAHIDFATRACTLVKPNEALAARQWNADALTPAERDHVKQHLFEELLPMTKVTPEPCDQLTAELTDFVSAVRNGHAPRVDGKQARAAVELAEQIVEEIALHPWDAAGRQRGPLAMPGMPAAAPLLRGPHWHRAPVSDPSSLQRP